MTFKKIIAFVIFWSYFPDFYLSGTNDFLIFFFFFLATLGLRCCTQAFSTCGKRGLLFTAVHGLLVTVASIVAEHRL